MFVVVSSALIKTAVNEDADLLVCFVQSVHNTKNEAIEEIKNNNADVKWMIGDVWFSKNANTRFQIIECDNKFGWNQIVRTRIMKED